MKLGMKVLNRIIVKLAKLQALIFLYEKSYLRKTSRVSYDSYYYRALIYFQTIKQLLAAHIK